MKPAQVSISVPDPWRPPIPRLSVVRVSVFAMAALIISSWLFIFEADRSGSGTAFLSLSAFERIWDFLIHELLGVDVTGRPAFARWSEWKDTMPLAYKTLAISVLSIGIAGIGALVTFMFGARNVMIGELAPYETWLWGIVFVLVRWLFTLLRSIPELVWAMIAVFIFTPGLLPAAIALGVHNAGVVGKLAAEVVEGHDPRSLQSLRTVGASRLQVLAYGVLPTALPRFLTVLFYRWEVIIRATIVVGFVAAGGLGFEFGLAMAHFKYTTVTLLLIWYLILVVLVDLIAACFRRLAK